MSTIDHIRSYSKVIKLTPYDTSTEEGRSSERHRRIALTAITSAFAKAITITTSFITVPLTLNYLGAERYGLWMTISSVIAMMVFADFGIGYGLVNAISEAYGNDDRNAIKLHIANAAVILGCIAFLILIIFFLIFPLISWGSFFNVKTPLAMAEAGPALAAFVVCFVIGIPSTIVQRVQMGLQQGFASSLWQAGGNILGLLLTLLVIYFRGGLFWLVLALAGSPVIFLLLNGVVFFLILCRDLAPDLRQVTRSGMKRILHGGILFFVLQLTVAITFASDNIIIANIINAESVAQYAVVSKLFEGVIVVIGIAVTPLWPAYGEAKMRGDRLWIKNTLFRSMTVTLVMVVISAALLVAFYRPLFMLWVGSKHSFSFVLVASYAVWMIIKGLGTTYSMFLNGMNILRFQMICCVILMLVSVPLKYLLVMKFGLVGIVIGIIISYLFISIIPSAFYTKKFLLS